MILGLDFNDVAANALEAKRGALEEVTGLSIPPANFMGKSVVESGKWFPSRIGAEGRCLEYADYDKAMRMLFETDAFFRLVQPMAGAPEAIKTLTKSGCEVRIISSVKGLKEGRMWAWIARYELPVTKVIATRKKPKTPHYEECDVVIDDKLEHLEPLLGHDNTKILMLSPLLRKRNLALRIPSSISVAASWEEISKHLKTLH